MVDGVDVVQYSLLEALVSSRSSINLQDGLQFLTKVLNKFHGRRALVLIDDYDAPINYMLWSGADEAECMEVVHTIRRLLSICLEENQNLYRGVVTGLFDCHIYGESVFLRDMNIVVYRIHSYSIRYLFGFEQEEVQELILQIFHTPHSGLQRQLLDQIVEWYSGYRYNYRSVNRETTSPRSLIRYLKKCIDQRCIAQGEPFLPQTQSQMFLKRVFSQANKFSLMGSLCRIINDQNKLSENWVSLDYRQNCGLSYLGYKKEPFRQKGLSYLLLEAGYLTSLDNKRNNSFGRSYHQRVPNRQASIVFKKTLKDWFSENISSDFSKIVIDDCRVILKKMRQIFGQKPKFVKQSKQYLNSLFALLYLFSEDQSHSVIIGGRSDKTPLILVPKPECSKSLVIHIYTSTVGPEEVENFVQGLMFEAYLQNCLSYPLQLAATSKDIEYITFRPIAIIQDQSTSQCRLQLGRDLTHTVQQAGKIFQFFTGPEAKKAMNSLYNTKDKIERLLNHYQVQNLWQLLYKCADYPLQLTFHPESNKFQRSRQKEETPLKKEAQPVAHTTKAGTELLQVQSSLKKINLNPQLHLQSTDFDYEKAMKDLPNVMSRKKKPISVARCPEEESDFHGLNLDFQSKFYDAESLFAASLEAIIDAVADERKAEEIHEALQRMRNDPSYFKAAKAQVAPQSKEKANSTADLQVFTALIRTDPLQEIYNRIDRVVRLSEEKTARQQRVRTKTMLAEAFGSLDQFPTRKVLVDSLLLGFDQKLQRQAAFFEREGVMFESLKRGIAEGAIALLRKGLSTLALKLSQIVAIEQTLSSLRGSSQGTIGRLLTFTRKERIEGGLFAD